MKDLLEMYRNYLLALQERKEHGNKYGDTEEMIKIYKKEFQKYGVHLKEEEENKK